MKRNIARMLPFYALALSGGMNMGNFDINTPVRRGGSSRGNRPFANGLTKKQKKARVRSKMAKQSRKVNYRINKNK